MAKFTVSHRCVITVDSANLEELIRRKTSRVFTMRGLTSQCAADLKFLLNGKDGKPDRMVSVEAYMKGSSLPQ